MSMSPTTTTIAEQIAHLGCTHPYTEALPELDVLAAAIADMAPGKVYGIGTKPVVAREIGRRLIIRRTDNGYEIDYAWRTMDAHDEDPDSISDNPFGFGGYSFERRRAQVPTARNAAEVYLRIRKTLRT